MNNCKIEIVGVYKVPVTDELFQKAMETKFGSGLSFFEKLSAKKTIKAELSSVVLVEVIIKNPSPSINISDFSQPDSDQVAYDEAFLNRDGTSILSRSKMPDGDDVRLVFFLHFYDPSKPIKSSCGILPASNPTDMPPRLKELVPYEPID